MKIDYKPPVVWCSYGWRPAGGCR